MPEVSVKDNVKLDMHTRIVQRTFELCLVGHQSVARTTYGLENPEDMGPQFASQFCTEKAESLRRSGEGGDFKFDRCMFGLEYRKPTQILSSCAYLEERERRCTQVPGGAPAWDPLERWHEILRTVWKVLEHYNIGELRTMVIALRRLSRSQSALGTKAFVIADPLVAT